MLPRVAAGGKKRNPSMNVVDCDGFRRTKRGRERPYPNKKHYPGKGGDRGYSVPSNPESTEGQGWTA